MGTPPDRGIAPLCSLRRPSGRSISPKRIDQSRSNGVSTRLSTHAAQVSISSEYTSASHLRTWLERGAALVDQRLQHGRKPFQVRCVVILLFHQLAGGRSHSGSHLAII